MKFYDSLLFSCLLLGEQSNSVLFLYYAIVAASSPGGSLKGAAAPFMAIRSGGMYGARIWLAMALSANSRTSYSKIRRTDVTP